MNHTATATGGSADGIAHILRRKSRDILILVVAVAILGPVLLLTQFAFARQNSTVYTPVVDSTSRLMIAMRWAQSDMRMDRAFGLPGGEDRLRTREADALSHMNRLYELVGDDPEFAPTLERMKAAGERWWTYTHSEARTAPAAPSGSYTPLETEDVNATADFTAIIQASDELYRLASEKRMQLQTVRNAILAGGSALALAVVVVVSVVIVRNTRRTAALIATPLEDLDRVARSEAQGGRGYRAPTDRGPAEVRELAEAFNNLLDTRDAYEQNRDEYVRRLEELDRQKDDFVSTVSHELRTPLASIVGYTEMLEDGDAGELTAEQLGMVAVIRRNSDRLRGLIEDLLVLSRIEAGGLEIDRSRVSLGSVVSGVLESCGPVATRSGITLHEDVGSSEVEVEGDALHLERAVTNLLSNAIKFTPTGGEVAVRLTSGDGEAIVEVADTGIGVPAAEQEHLGTRFFRSSTAQRQSIPGTGLGLSIVRAIAESHEGELTFESVEGEGTTFRLRVPLLGAPAIGDTGTDAEGAAEGADHPGATDAAGSAASSR